jgi:TolA-binding protein
MWARIGRTGRRRPASLLIFAALLAGSASVATAQDAGGEVRLRKIEAEVRALQRKVFPGGDEKFFKPEVTTGTTATTGTSTSSTSAVTDMLTRMDAIEAQLARLTGQVEETTNRVAVLEQRAGIVRPATAAVTPATTDAPANAVTAATVPAAGVPAAGVASTPVSTAPAVAVAPAPAPVAPQPALTTPKPATTTTATAAPSASRVAAVRAIEKPQTNDPADDEYSYGFRLWEAKFYPEARQQLKMFVDKYPRHSRVSFGRNLLGRAYLDDGQPAEAAKWFLENYQADKRGARAPDSLLLLATSMKKLKDDKRACIALAEFSETYAAEAAGRLKGQYDETRRGLSCPT